MVCSLQGTHDSRTSTQHPHGLPPEGIRDETMEMLRRGAVAFRVMVMLWIAVAWLAIQSTYLGVGREKVQHFHSHIGLGDAARNGLGQAVGVAVV